MIAKWRVRALGNVLRDAWPAMLAISGLVVSVDVAGGLGRYFDSKLSDQFLYAGMTLELLGIGLVASEMNAILKKFGRPALLAQVKGWFGRLASVFMPMRHAVGKAVGRSESFSWAHGRGIVRSGQNANAEERIAALERNLDNFRDEIDATLARRNKELLAANDSLFQATWELKQTQGIIDRKVEDLAVGGVPLEVIGWIWVIFGIFGRVRNPLHFFGVPAYPEAKPQLTALVVCYVVGGGPWTTSPDAAA